MKPSSDAINQISVEQSTSPYLALKMSRLLQEIRTRAYQLFERRGHQNGHDLEDWLQAEKELGRLRAPQIDESKEEIRIRIDRPEFIADQLKVFVEPNAISLEGVAVQTVRSGGPQQEERKLFGRYELQRAIDTNLVTAILRNGVLEIVARKADTPAEPLIANKGKSAPIKPKLRKSKHATV